MKIYLVEDFKCKWNLTACTLFSTGESLTTQAESNVSWNPYCPSSCSFFSGLVLVLLKLWPLRKNKRSRAPSPHLSPHTVGIQTLSYNNKVSLYKEIREACAYIH